MNMPPAPIGRTHHNPAAGAAPGGLSRLRLATAAATIAAAFAGLAPTTVMAQPLPTSCGELLTDPLSPIWTGRPEVFSATSVQATTGGRAYCNISVVWRDPTLVGEGDLQPDGTYFPGYATGNGPPTTNSYQHVRMGFGLPLNTNTGTAAWSRRAFQTAGGLDQGSVAGFTGYVGATDVSTGVGGITGQAGIGMSTDSGHGTADSGSGNVYGYIQNTRPNYGKLKDWAGGRSYCTAVKLAKQLAMFYYGQPVLRTYWQGFSGGGHMGMTQVQNCPEEYDGVLAGAPSYHWQQFRLQDSWAQMVNKKNVQIGAGITNAQRTSVANAALAWCQNNSATGGFPNSTTLMHDPRSCGYNAAWHVCGHPLAPATNCLTPGTRQAELMNQILNGPVNDHGMLVYYPYSHQVGISNDTTVFTLSTPQVLNWNHFSTFNGNTNLFADREALELAGSPAAGITFADEMHLGTTRMSDFADTSNFRLEAALEKGLKIIQTHGTSDNLILFRQDPAYYRRVAVHLYGSADYEALQDWYRLYIVPGQGHAALALVPNLINWVENGVAPGALTGNSRRVCPYPQYAHWDGVGAQNDVNSYTCQGNLETSWVAQCSMVKTPYKQEDQPLLDYAGMGIDPNGCPPSLTLQVVPGTLNLRTTAGLVTVVVGSQDGRDLRNWGLGDMSIRGSAPMSVSYSSDGKSAVLTFTKASLAALPAGDKVWLTLIGSFNRSGESTRMQATGTVKVMK